MIHSASPKASPKTQDTIRQTPPPNGYVTLIAIGFITLVTLSLTTLSTTITQHISRQLKDLRYQNVSLHAETAMQIGLARLRDETAALLADEAGRQYPSSIADPQMIADRNACLADIAGYLPATANSYLASSPLKRNDIQSRFFIHDISAGTTPRVFEIHGCAMRGVIVKHTLGIWQFNPANSGSFDLIALRYY